jgi:hypothetical protein
MIGRLAGTKAQSSSENGKDSKTEKYEWVLYYAFDHKTKQNSSFQANQFQLEGPVPPDLYHRFVEFKPFVKGMFSKAGLRGRILNKALHHQHSRVYNFSNTTEYGIVKPKSEEASLQFLKWLIMMRVAVSLPTS